MNIERVTKLLAQKEDIHLEFKEARNAVPGNVYESICAMLNRDGGDILLGVDDNGIVKGIAQPEVEKMKQSIVNNTNNPQKINPPFILNPISYEINGDFIIHIQVPCSSQIHRTNDGIYDRGNEGDFLVKEPYLIAEMYDRKRNFYTEGKIYPKATLSDLKQDLFKYSRALIRSNNPNHPWLALDDMDLLRISGLYRKEMQTGEEGLSLAAILLLGKDETIQSILPHYKTDLLVRKVDLERYDDRENVTANLIESYDQAMAFIAKHLPDKPYYENEQRISLRTYIFREIIGNLLIHREYTNAMPARLIIYQDRVETENANNAHGSGELQLNNYTPYPKNPLIAKFFNQLGRAEELGSGVQRVNKYLPIYSPGTKPDFIEGPSFKTVIPIMEPVPYEIWDLDKSAGNKPLSAGNKPLSAGNKPLSAGNKPLSAGNKPLSAGIGEHIDQVLTFRYETTRQQYHDLVYTILNNEEQAGEYYSTQLNIKPRTIERYLKQLKEALIIESIGKTKSTLYKVTQEFKRKLYG
jgi:ATP-dependent DNA helicase RecG